MNFFNKMKLATKMYLLTSLLMVLVVGLAIGGMIITDNNNKGLTDSYENSIKPLNSLNNMRISNRYIVAATLSMTVIDANDRPKYMEIISNEAKKVNDEIEKYEKVEKDNEEKRLWAEFKPTLQLMREERSKTLELLNQGKIQEGVHLYTSTKPNRDKFDDILTKLIEKSNKDTEATIKEVQSGGKFLYSFLTIIPIVTLIFCLIYLYFIKNKIFKPLNELVNTLNQISNFDLKVKKFDIKSQDEIGYLQESSNRMVDKLTDFASTLVDSSDQVASSAKDFVETSSQSAEAANQIAVAITQIADGSQTQVSALNNVQQSIEQMGFNIDKVNSNTMEVVGMVNKTVAVTNEGKDTIDRSINQMNEVERNSKVVSELAEQFKHGFQEINGIIDVIAGIANQTNLLSLNASIEAARAGEQGRGFAVVADEVRKLAEQSQEATKQIAELIKTNSKNLDEVVSSIDKSNEVLVVGIEYVNQANAKFNDIDKMTNTVNDKVREVEKLMEQLLVSSGEIVSSVDEIDNATNQSAENVQTVSASTEEQSAAMEEMAASSEALSKLAQDLKDIANNFKV